MYNYSVYYILLGVSVTWYKAVIPNMSISGVTGNLPIAVQKLSAVQMVVQQRALTNYL